MAKVELTEEQKEKLKKGKKKKGEYEFPLKGLNLAKEEKLEIPLKKLKLAKKGRRGIIMDEVL